MLAKVLIVGLVGGLLIGQVIRAPLPGQGGGVLLSALAVVIILISVLITAVRCRVEAASSRQQAVGDYNQPLLLATKYLLLFMPFIVWALFTLLVNSWRYEFVELTIAGAYWLRLVAHLLLLPALVIVLAGKEAAVRWLVRGMLVTSICLAALGLAQLFFVPDLRVLGAGWDPHLGRMVATWLDPNFLGLFFVLSGALAASVTATSRERLLPGLALVASVLGLVMTESRSALVAALVTLGLLSPLLLSHHRKWIAQHRTVVFALAASLGVLLILSVAMLGQRALGLATGDATIMLRFESLAAVWQLAQQQGLIGIGYNGYQFVAKEAGLVTSFTVHSRAGADSSLLTLWVATGLVGVMLWLVSWVGLARQLLLRWQTGAPLALAGVASILAVATHSLFVNSWLYAHVLLSVVIMVVLGLVATRQTL